MTIGVDGAFLLSGVSPNPFRDQARFTLTVKGEQAVNVSVYDVLGRRVSTLHEGMMGTGALASFALKDQAWASGTYVVVVDGETFCARRTVTLVR